jgi:hypothetical protein
MVKIKLNKKQNLKLNTKNVYITTYYWKKPAHLNLSFIEMSDGYSLS